MNAPSIRQRGVILIIYRLYISIKWQIGHRTSEFCIDAAVLTDQSSNPFMKNFWSLLSYWLILPRGSLKHDQEKQAATALSWKWKQFWVTSTSQWYWGDPGHWHGTKQGMQDYIHLLLRGNSSLECGHVTEASDGFILHKHHGPWRMIIVFLFFVHRGSQGCLPPEDFHSTEVSERWIFRLYLDTTVYTLPLLFESEMK